MQFVREHFRTPLHFYNDLLCKSIESGIDFSASKHANSIWDLQLTFYALPAAVIAGKPVVLVSNERAIKAAASRAGAGGRVITLNDYRARLAGGSFWLDDNIVGSADALPSSPPR